MRCIRLLLLVQQIASDSAAYSNTKVSSYSSVHQDSDPGPTGLNSEQWRGWLPCWRLWGGCSPHSLNSVPCAQSLCLRTSSSGHRILLALPFLSSQEKFSAFKDLCNWIGSTQRSQENLPHLKVCNFNHTCNMPSARSVTLTGGRGSVHRHLGRTLFWTPHKSICWTFKTYKTVH